MERMSMERIDRNKGLFFFPGNFPAWGLVNLAFSRLPYPFFCPVSEPLSPLF